jgi:hypothetical protein
MSAIYNEPGFTFKGPLVEDSIVEIYRRGK